MVTRRHDFKIIKGHTLEEYKKKYGKLYNRGKLFDFKPSEDCAFNYYKRTYWEIKDKKGRIRYYSIPNVSQSVKTGIVCFAFLAGVVTGSVFLTRHLSMPGRSFKTDSWRQFSEIANQGLDKLKEVYKPNGGTFIITPEDNTQAKIDAKMRTVKVDGHGTFKVRVIGEAHDTLSSDESKTAALTFEFVDIVDDAIPYNQKYPKTTGDHPYPQSIIDDYKNTLIHEYCNNALFDMLPNDLQSAIQPVKKTTICRQTQPTNIFYECVTDEKLFPLSAHEMGAPSDYGAGVEGSTYEYYFTHNTAVDYLKHYYDKNVGIRNAVPYWTRTTSKGTSAFTISYGGYFGDSSSTSTSWFAGISPAFSIGVNEHNFITDSWENIAEQADQGLNHLKEYYGRNTFVGEIRKVNYQDQSYRVRVIGENHDTIADTDNKKVAALTFQFLDAPIPDVIYDDDSSDWSTSDLRQTCNNLKSSLPTGLSSNIKPVLKEAVKQTDTNAEIVKNTEYLFPLSAIETGDTAYSDAEGSVYKYFESRYTRQLDEARTNSYVIGSNIMWLASPQKSWSRSAHLAVNNKAYVFCGANTSSNISIDINNPAVVAPAFCLGEDNAKPTFNNDSWKNVIKHANEGLNSLKKAYGLTTFVGQTRKLKYDNQEYNVRVIGEATDTLANEKNLASALTFEFTKPIMESIYDDNSTDWETSTLRANCEAAYDKIDAEVKDAIQPVTKETYCLFYTNGEGDPVFNIPRKTTIEKLFPLSEYEITSDYAATELGGPKYKYYDVHFPSIMTNSRWVSTNRPAKEPFNGEYKSYWLRSPIIESGIVNYAYSVEYNGTLHQSYKQGDYITSSKGLCPVFNIGKTRSFMSDSWENLINALNKGGLPYLRYIYGRSDFIGEERDIVFENKKVRVRVIDQYHDQLAKNDLLAATFTFDCVEIMDTAPWNKTVSTDIDDYCYLNSDLYQFLSNEDDPNSLISRFKKSNKFIYDNIKPVKKFLTDLAIVGGFEPEDPYTGFVIDYNTYEAKMFVPDLGDLFAADIFGVFTTNVELTLPYQFQWAAYAQLGGVSKAAGVPGHRAKSYYYWVANPYCLPAHGLNQPQEADPVTSPEDIVKPFGVAPMFCL